MKVGLVDCGKVGKALGAGLAKSAMRLHLPLRSRNIL
jgi:hypothetical protein